MTANSVLLVLHTATCRCSQYATVGAAACGFLKPSSSTMTDSLVHHQGLFPAQQHTPAPSCKAKMMLPLASHVCMEVDSHMRCCCALSCGCCVGSNLVCAGPRRCRVFAIQGTGMGDSSTGPDYFRLRSARHVAASAQQCQDTAVPSHVADWLVCRDCSRHSAWQHVQQLVWHAALCCEPSRHRSGTCTHAAPIVVSRHGDTMMVATAWLVIINHPSPDVLSTSCHGAPAAAAQHSHTQLQLRMMPCETCCCSWAFKAESCHCCQAQFVCYTTGTQPARAHG